MSARILDGKQIAADMRETMRHDVADLAKRGIVPGLGVVLVGDDPASHSYVTAKEKACAETGILSVDHRLPASTAQEDLLALIATLNRDPRIHGILVQLPLPRQLDEKAVLLAIDPDKDVDGFHPLNVGRMVSGQPAFLPCTPHGVLQMLAHRDIPIEGAHAVIVGRSQIVGKPLANLLMRKDRLGNATVTVCHTRSRDIAAMTRQADILIAAAGQPHMITADMVSDGAVVIDVGVNRIDDPSRKRGYRLVGDVDYDAVSQKASWITPVPGGVGPMTITMLLYNTIASAQRRR